jgi:hypothetical protein
MGITAVSPTRAVGIVPTLIDEMVAAFAAGATTTANPPKPNADTATSAMRLSVVFVDICFLSLVDPGTFLESAWQRVKPFTA